MRAEFHASFLRFGRRKALALAVASAAAGLAVSDSGQIVQARVALGAVAPTPIRARKAEQILQGEKITPGLLAEAAAMAATEISPISDLRGSADYRRKISAVLVRRTLENALGQSNGGEAVKKNLNLKVNGADILSKSMPKTCCCMSSASALG